MQMQKSEYIISIFNKVNLVERVKEKVRGIKFSGKKPFNRRLATKPAYKSELA